MSENHYSEYEPSDDEVTALLDEMYPNDVIVCGMPMSQSYILRRLDKIAFDEIASNSFPGWICDECDTTHETESDAKDCCQEYCSECGEPVEGLDLCENCQAIEDEEETEEGEEE